MKTAKAILMTPSAHAAGRAETYRVGDQHGIAVRIVGGQQLSSFVRDLSV